MSAWKEWMLARESGDKEREKEAYLDMIAEANKERYFDEMYKKLQYAEELFGNDMKGEDE